MQPDPNAKRDPQTAIRGANLVRAVNGMASMDPRLRAVRCPWCLSAPGAGCVVAATGARLTLTPAHPARYAAAGLAEPAVDAAALAERRAA